MRGWFVAVLVALVAGAVGLLVGLDIHAGHASASMAKHTLRQLRQEKLQQQISLLQISNQQEGSIEHSLLAWAPFVTGIAAVAAVGATLWKQATDLESARTQLVDEQEKTRVANEQWQARFLEDQRSAREHEQEESLRRFDANISAAITNLGAVSETLQVNAAAALATYMKPRYASFHVDLLAVVTANLRLQPTAAVARVLRSDLERLLRLLLGNPAAYGDDLPHELDFTRSPLQRFDVSGIDFGATVVDIAFADLSDARLVDAKLFRLRGREVRLERAYCSRALLREARLDGAHCRGVKLHNANLVSASLKHADLTGAQFQEALMQEAHLEGANLEGANFTRANLANTYFNDAQFDQAALRSIAHGALRWRDNNNFDTATRQALEHQAQR